MEPVLNHSLRGTVAVVLLFLATELKSVAFESIIDGRAMGMSFRVTFASDLADKRLTEFERAVNSILNEADRTFSLYRSDSEISRWNAVRSTEWVTVSRSLVELVDHSRKLSSVTKGRYDPTIRPVAKLWRFDRVDRSWVPPTDEEIKKCLPYVGMLHVHTQHDPPSLRKEFPEVELDLNSLVEGWCLDRIAMILEAEFETDFLIRLGGEFIARGMSGCGKPWKIGVESPVTSDRKAENNTAIYVELMDQAVSTSGSYRSGHEYDGRWYGHLLDAITGYPISNNRILTSVVADSALEADGWATALQTLDAVSCVALCNDSNIASLMVSESEKEPTYFCSRHGKLVFQGVNASRDRSEYPTTTMLALRTIVVLVGVALLLGLVSRRFRTRFA